MILMDEVGSVENAAHELADALCRELQECMGEMGLLFLVTASVVTIRVLSNLRSEQ